MASIMTVRAPEELQKSLSEKAKKRGFTRNGLILKILWDWDKVNAEKSKSQPKQPA